MSAALAFEARGIRVRYGKAVAVRDAALALEPGTITALVGPNGAGKTSMLQAFQGVIPCEAESIVLHGKSLIGSSATQRVKAGLVLVPQGRMLFRHLSVRDNLLVVANAFGVPRVMVDKALERFPILKERQRSFAGVLSGGEQQMLALARALMCEPAVLVLDEPTLGLAPSVVKGVMDILVEMRTQGKSILVAEPTTRLLTEKLDRGYIILHGRVIAETGGLADLEQQYHMKFDRQERVPAG